MIGDDSETREAIDLEKANKSLTLDPREGDETEVTERDGGGGAETRRSPGAVSASGPREGDDTEKIRESPTAARGLKPPRKGDDTESTPFILR